MEEHKKHNISEPSDIEMALVTYMNTLKSANVEKVKESFMKEFKTYTSVKISEEESRIIIPVAFIAAKSNKLYEEYLNGKKLKIPSVLISTINFKYVTFTGKDIIDVLNYGCIFDVKPFGSIDYSTIKFSDLLYYVYQKQCININKELFAVLKQLISVFIIQLLTPATKINTLPYKVGGVEKPRFGHQSLLKCDGCFMLLCSECNSSDGIFWCKHKYQPHKHKLNCEIFIHGDLFVDFASSVLEIIPYIDMYNIYMNKISQGESIENNCIAITKIKTVDSLILGSIKEFSPAITYRHSNNFQF